jgi:hypothetical protein
VLRAIYELADDLPPGMAVDLQESRGLIRIRVSSAATLEEALAALNPVAAEFLAGGQWFQLWEGEIVTMHSPDDPAEGGTVARIHRGPVVQARPRRSQDKQADAG